MKTQCLSNMFASGELLIQKIIKMRHKIKNTFAIYVQINMNKCEMRILKE